ncbi:MAG: dihydrolipoyl dehydrogenase [Planctomycetes bacterium]|nr:dihydrolipoyl dehydrogenase [Planctomycetota bacterium]
MQFANTVVIGSGPGGYVAAIRLAQLGVETTLIEKGPMGGVCLNWGCIPSKAYISAAKVVEHIESAGDIGIKVSHPEIDLAKMKDWKDGIVSRLTTGIRALLTKAGVTIVEGRARLTGGSSLEIEGKNGKTTLAFANAILATGSRSLEIPPFPYDGESVISSTEALDLTKIPKSLCVIGGGVIGLEIGMYLSAFGTQVTVVEMMDQILPGTDPDIVKALSRVLKKRGIKVMTSTRAKGFEKKGKELVVQVDDAKGKAQSIACDKILVSVGRKPNSEDLGLEQAGVTLDERGFIRVDHQLRTSNPQIFAIGDVTGGALLAHKASKEGLVAASVIAGAEQEVYDVRAMPAAVFTDPEIAMVGLTEEAAKSAGHEIKVGRYPFTAHGKAMASRETEGFIKIIADAKDDRVLGVHIIGYGASDLISEAALAIEMGATSEDIALTVHPHPTMGETMMEAAEAVHGMAIHMFKS